MNHFDDFFDAHVKSRKDLQLLALPSDEREPFPVEACLWILKATNVILDNCTNRHMYESTEHLSSLLACDDTDVALAALRLLASATRRTPGSRSNRFRAERTLRSRLLALCGGLSDGVGAGRDAADDGAPTRVFGLCVGGGVSDGRVASTREESSSSVAMHFEFYSPGGADEMLGDLGSPGSRTIAASVSELSKGRDHDVTTHLAEMNRVPSGLRFSLFARVRLAKLASSPERGKAAEATLHRLLAFTVLLQSDRSDAASDAASDDALGLVFLAEPQPEFIGELLRVLRLESEGVPPAVVETSLRVLAALVHDRSHQLSVIAAMRRGGHASVLAALVSSAVTRLTEAPCAPFGATLTAAKLPKLEIDAINKDADAPVPLAEALVSLLSTLVVSHTGCLFLRDVSLLPVLMPLLRNRNPRHVHIVSHAVHVLEIFMDYAAAAAAAFRELGGMEILVERLKLEADDALAEHAATHGTGSGSASAAAPAEIGSSTAMATDGGDTATGSTSTTASAPAPVYLVSSTRRVLLKALMRALALTNFSPGTVNVKVAGLEDGTLCGALNLIFTNPRLFGAGVFSLAANLLCDVMNHEPTCYPKLDAQGVPKAFLDAWERDDPGPVPTADSLCCLPNTLGALSLSPSGLERVKASTALNALVIAFTTRGCLRAVQGETSSAIGGNLDELLRHVPSLQPQGVQLAIDVLRRLVETGGGDPDEDAEPRPDAPTGEAPMDTDADTPATTTGGEKQVGAAATTPVSPSFLTEAVANVARLVDSMLPTDECAQQFVQKGGIRLLIQLHTLPHLPHTFSSSSACHALSITLRSLSGAGRTHSSVLAECTQRALVKSLRAASRAMLDTLEDDTMDLESDAILVECVQDVAWDPSASPALPRASRAHAIRETVKPLAEAEALLNLTTSLLRSSPSTLQILTDARKYTGGIIWQCGVIGAVAYTHRVSLRVLSRLAVGGKKQVEFAKEVAERAASAKAKDDCLKFRSTTSEAEKLEAADASRRHERCKLAVEALKAVRTECTHFRSSFHFFCSSLAKNVASSRYMSDRNDPNGRQPFRLPAVELAYELGHSLHDPFCIPVGRDSRQESDVRFMCSLFSTLHAVLVDERRRCTQNLLINFMRHQGSLEILADVFKQLWKYFAHVVARERSSRGDAEEPSKSEPLPDFLVCGLKISMALMQQLLDVSVVFGSSTATTHLTLPYPTSSDRALNGLRALESPVLGEELPFRSSRYAVALHWAGRDTIGDAKSFLEELHRVLKPAVLAAWNSPALEECPGETLVILMSVLEHLGGGPQLPENLRGDFLADGRGDATRDPRGRAQARAAEAPRRIPERPPAPPFVPSPTMTASIREMGFSEAQARAALVAVRGRSIEMAMEWLFTHPAEAQAADDAERERARLGAAAAENATATGGEETTATTANAGEGRGGEGSAPPGSEPAGNAPADADADAPPSNPSTGVTSPDADAELMRALEMSMAEEEDVDADEDGEEPPASPPPRAKKRHVAADDAPLPTPSKLLPTILHLAVKNEAMLHPGAKLLTREMGSVDRSERVAAVAILSRTISAQFAQLREGDADETHEARLRAAVHLLALLLVADPIATSDVAEEGLADVVLGHLETFLTAREASGGDAAIPEWASGLLLITHALARWRPPTEKEKTKLDEENVAGGKASAPDSGSSVAAALAGVLGDPMGHLDDASCDRATEICVRVLKLTERSEPAAPGVTVAGARTSDADVGGVQAALQLLAHLTKRHSRAKTVLDCGCVPLILDLPCRFAFPAYDALASSILRHALEDPGTLQAAMESEIHATMNAPGMAQVSLPRGRATLRHFINATLPVFAREPTCFLSAMEKCAAVEEANGRRVVVLRKTGEQNTAAAKSETGKDAAGKDAGKVSAQTPAPKGGAKASDRATTPKSHGKSRGSKPPPTFAAVIDALVNAVLAYPPPAGLVPMDADEAADASDADAGAGSGEKVPPAPTLAAVRASLALRLLTDFALVYVAVAGQLLRRDSETGLLRHILHVQLPAVGAESKTGAADPGWDGGERAGYALLAMCVRSPEARRRILGEVAKALRHGSEETGTGTGTAAGASSGPARAFVELVNSLVKTAASKATLAGELQRGMRDAELLPALCAALERVDLNDPDAPAIVNAILRPMEALTRPGAGTKGAGAGARGGTGDGGEAGRDAAGGSTGTGTTPPARTSSGRIPSSDAAPSTSPGRGGAGFAELHHDPAQMARMGDMVDTMMGHEDDGDDDSLDVDDDDESAEEEEGESGEEGEEEEEEESESDEEGIDPMDDEEEHEETAMRGGEEDDDEEIEGGEDVRDHRDEDDDIEEMEDMLEEEERELEENEAARDGEDAEDDVDEDEEDVIDMGDDDDGADEWGQPDLDDVIRVDAVDQDGFGMIGNRWRAEEDEEADDAAPGDLHLGEEEEGEDAAAQQAADRLAGELRGIIAGAAGGGGGQQPVVELRVRDMRLRELVVQHGGSAILRGGPFGGGGLGRDSRLGGRGGAASLAGGGILSDIFALRRSLDEARRESGDGRGGGSSGRVSSGSEVVAAGLADGGASSMAHPMLVRPRSMDSGDRARGDDGDAAENGDRPAASMRAILAEISGEMSRLAVGQQNGGRGGGASHGSGGDHGGRHRERTDSGFVVLPAAESLSPFLRVNRRDGRAGGESVARRGISVVDARAATWADVGALRDESSLRGSAVAGAFEEYLAAALKPPEPRSREEDAEMAPAPEPPATVVPTPMDEPGSEPAAEEPAAERPAAERVAAEETSPEQPSPEQPSPEEPASGPADADDAEEDSEEVPEEEVDSEFLNALPPDLREELVSTNRAIARLNRGVSSANGSDAAPPMDAVDPEFLSALPPDMQAEVIQQQTREVRRLARDHAERAERDASAAVEAMERVAGASPTALTAARSTAESAASAAAAARAAATAAGVPPPAGGALMPAEVDNASIIASFPEDARRDVLLSADAATLASLPPALQTEARRLRQAMDARAASEGASRGADDDDDGVPPGAEAALANFLRLDPARQTQIRTGVMMELAGDPDDPARNRADFARQLRSMLGLSGPGPSRRGSGGLTAADRAALASGAANAIVSPAALDALVRLLRLAPPLGGASGANKGALPRVLLNLAAHGGTRDAIIRVLFATIRAATEANEPGSETRGCGKLYGRNVHVVCATPEAAARLLTRRALETALFLARHSTLVATRIPAVAATRADADAVVAASSRDVVPVKCPARIPNANDEGDAAASGPDAAPLLLLRALASPAFVAHAGHIELTLQLLETTLVAAVKERKRRVEALEKHRDACDAFVRARAGSETTTEETAGVGGKPPKAPKLSADAAGPSGVSKEAPEGTHTSAASNDTRAVSNPGETLPVAPDATRTAASRIRASVSAARAERLRALAALLARDGLTGLAYSRVTESNRALAIIAPERRDALAAALSEEAAARVDDVLAALEASKSAAAAAAARSGASEDARAAEAARFETAAAAKLPARVTSAAPAFLRLVRAVVALHERDDDADAEAELDAAGEALSSRREIAGKAAEGAAAEEARALVRVPPRDALASARMGGVATRLATRDALRRFAERLAPAWTALSDASAAMEPAVAESTLRHQRTGDASDGRYRPTEFRHVLPVVEAYFGLAAAVNDASKAAKNASEATKTNATKTNARDESGGGANAGAPPSPPQDPDRVALGLARVASPAFGLIRSATPTLPTLPTEQTQFQKSSDRAATSIADVADGSDPVPSDGPGAVPSVWNFANEHRAMVNALVRTQPSLLDGSLRLLLEKPRLLDFDNKRSHIRAKLKKLAEGEAHQHRGAVRVQINRKQVLTDSFTQLQHLKPAEIRGKLTIQFSGEEGIDAGGLTREWYMLLAREMFNPEVALFELSPSGDGAYQPFSNSGINELHLSYFKFIGRIIGKAVYDGYLVDAHFTRPFYKHMLGIPLNYDDMEAFDPDYHRNLVYMLEHPLAESGLDHLTFSETSMYFDVETNVELIPGGHDVPVTDDNKLEYVNLVTAHRMTNAIKDQIAAFTEGFNDIVPHDVIAILNPSELELLISGTPDIDVEDLRANTEYQGYAPSAPQVRWFWEVVRELTEEDRARLLMFVTGTSKVPLDGFKALQGISGPQRFQIHKAYGGGHRLCSAHTCFNQLDLPEYGTKEELRDRLLFAIREGSEGFGFG